jgi:hypothetical protein
MITTIILAAALAIPTPSGADLERAYWDCDYASTVAFMGPDEAAYCSAVFEKLKAEKFGGDFTKFMAWWRANKGVQHKARTK